MLRPERLVRIYCIFPKDTAELVVDTLQKLGAVHLYDIREENYSLRELEGLYNTKFLEIHGQVRKLIASIESKARKKPFEWLFGARYTAIETQKRGIGATLKEAKKLLRDIKKEYGEINTKNASDIKKRYYARLLVISEQFENAKEKTNALKKFGSTEYTASFGGFAAREDVSGVLNALDTKTNGKCAFEIKDATADDEPPIKLSNPKIIKPFEILTENYGMPSYDGIDPTFILAFTFTLLFGIMFPDIGYGIILILLSSAVYLITRKTTKFVRNLNIILIYTGFASIIFGFLFGEFFGKFIELKPAFEPAKDIMMTFLLSIIIGLGHISTAIISNILVKRRILNYTGLLLSLWSVVFLLYTKNKYFLIVSLLGISMVLFSRGIYAIEDVISLLIHVMSYLRVGILSVLSISISKILVEAVSMLPRNFTGIVFGGVLVVAGFMFSFLLGIVSVIIQSLRLHWLEFFSIFEFQGEKFKPLGYRKEYIFE